MHAVVPSCRVVHAGVAAVKCVDPFCALSLQLASQQPTVAWLAHGTGLCRSLWLEGTCGMLVHLFSSSSRRACARAHACAPDVACSRRLLLLAGAQVEAAFYANGHAVRLRDLGCHVPFPLYVERARADGVTIVMTNLPGRKAPLSKAHAEAALEALAVLHAAYWGSAHADAAAGPGPGGGLQRQGTYWHLDTRPDEHEAMPRKGWEGRLRLAARAIDERLKADPLQTVCHGDPKDDNMLFAVDGDKVVAHLHDFQYCGKVPRPALHWAFIAPLLADPALSKRPRLTVVLLTVVGVKRARWRVCLPVVVGRGAGSCV